MFVNMEKPTILIFNKIDAYQFTPKEEDDLTPATKENVTLEELKRTWLARINGKCVFISATNRTNIEELRNTILDSVKQVAENIRY